jgi:hypothetical protein
VRLSEVRVDKATAEPMLNSDNKTVFTRVSMVAFTGVPFVGETLAKVAWNGMPLSRANDLEGVSGSYNEICRWYCPPQLSAPSRDIVSQATDEQQAEQARHHCCRPYTSCSAQKYLHDWHSCRCIADRLDVRTQDIHHGLLQTVSNVDRCQHRNCHALPRPC